MTCRGLIVRPPQPPQCANCMKREQPGTPAHLQHKLIRSRYYCRSCWEQIIERCYDKER